MTDKAVSTEDLCVNQPRNASLEAARLEAVIKTLIENKVESLKNAKRKSSSITSSPKRLFNKLRGNSTSTLSSKDKDEIVSIHSQLSRKDETDRRIGREHRKRKTSHNSPRRTRISKKPHERTLQFSDEEGNENLELFHKDQQFAQALDCSENCYCHQNPNEIQIEDFISLNLEDYDNLDPEEVEAIRTVKRAQRKKRRRRRSRRQLKMTAVAVQVNDFKELDEDELSKRARMTIILTAFLLLFMCLLLVGITLRMAPLIDDMDSRCATLHHSRSVTSARMALQSQSAPLDFPEIDRLIDDFPTMPPRTHVSSSVDDIRAFASFAAPKRAHRHSCQMPAFESPPRRKSVSSNRRSSTGSSRRHRPATAAASGKWMSPEQRAHEKKRRRTVCIVAATFLFILCSCVLVVIVTLTHQTELKRNSTLLYYTFAPPPDLGQETTTGRAATSGDWS